MKATELRIGNLVEKNGEIFESDCITIRMAVNYNPILLTEEWLKKLGFEWNEKKKTWRKEYKIPFVEDGKRIAIHVWKGQEKENAFWGVTLYEVVPIDDITPTVFYSVHQLQNLYFALTGEELALK